MNPSRHILAFLSRQAADQIYGPEIRGTFHARSASDPFRYDGDWKQATDAALAQCNVLLGGWGTPWLGPDLLAKLPRLELVLYGAGSLRPIASEALWERGIPVCSAASANAIPVADFALAQIILGLKQAFQTRGLHPNEAKAKLESQPLHGTFRSKVGLVSLGNIGRLVAKKLQAFDVEVVAFDPFASPDLARELRVNLVDLDTLFSTCHAVSVHTPNLPETRGLIGYSHLIALPRGAVFINTARGPIIREAEMIQVLQERPDIQALLDVTDPEPAAPDSPLRQLPNAFLTPHLSGSRGLECRRMGEYMLRDLENYLHGRPLTCQVTHQQFLRNA